MKDNDLFTVALTRQELILIWLSLYEYRFQKSRDKEFKNKNKLTRLQKRIEKYTFKEK